MRDNSIPLANLDSSKKKILVVDDEQDIVEVMAESLEHDGRFEVKIARNGFDAGVYAQQFRPDLIILDYMLPDINANVVTKTIRSNPSLEDTRIILISGLVEDDKVRYLLANGADAFMRKPFLIDDLIGKISEFLRV